MTGIESAPEYIQRTRPDLPLLRLVRALGDRVVWIGSPTNSREIRRSIANQKTCWALDGKRASIRELALALGPDNPIAKKTLAELRPGRPLKRR